MSKTTRTHVPCPTCDGLRDPRATTCLTCRTAEKEREAYRAVDVTEPKTCTTCGEEKISGDFRLRKVSDRKGGGQRRESSCLDCVREDARNRARARHEAGHPWSNALYTLRHNARRIFRVDPDSLVKFVKEHEGRCEICGRTADEATPSGKRLAVDHNDSGVRGMLCHHCNVGLGHFEDDPQRMLKAIAYLERPVALPRTLI